MSRIKKIARIIQRCHAFITFLRRKLLGFKFHTSLAKIANLIARAVLGRGLSFRANAALQYWAARIFGGSVGWISIVYSGISLTADLINKKRRSSKSKAANFLKKLFQK